MYKYEEIVLERVSLLVEKRQKGRRGWVPEGRVLNSDLQTPRGTCIESMGK